MGRSGAAFAAALILACTASCSTPTPPAAPSAPATTATTTRPATTTKPTAPPFTPLVSPAKVKAACPFLGTGELQVLLGTSEDLVATEQPADPTYVPDTEFECRYEGKYRTPWVLSLWIVAATRNYVPVRSVENAKRDCRGPVTTLPGIGEAAIRCELAAAEGQALVMTGKRSHGQNRTATVYMVTNRADVYTALAKTLADRL